MRTGSSRRNFIRRTLFGGAIAGLISRVASPAAKAESRPVDRRKLGRTGADVSILGLGLGAAFMEQNLGTAHALLESALTKGINYWDTARSYGPSEAMIAPVLERKGAAYFWPARAMREIMKASSAILTGVCKFCARTISIYINYTICGSMN